MNSRKIEMGSTSASGDFRHELGHALHSSFGGSDWTGKKGATNAAVASEYKGVTERGKEDPPPPGGKMSYEEYETKYGIIGRRALDNGRENLAEHYRGYHREIYKDRHEGGGGKNLDTYRERHPGWADIWDAHYTTALLGETE